MAQSYNKHEIINIVSRYADAIRTEITVNKIFLYGSYSKGNPQSDSDIDVAVISPDFSGDIIEDQILLMKYRRNIDLRIEPKPFRPEEFDSMNPFVREILNTGIEVQ